MDYMDFGMKLPSSDDVKLCDVVKAITLGEYRVPRFQRDFVWEVKESADLMDSIFRGYPIGSVILWKTKNDLPEIRRLGGIDIPGKETGRYTSYIIDGQQRLTSVYFSLMGLKTGDGKDFSKMCISLTADPAEQLVFEEMPANENPDEYVSLHNLFNRTALKDPYLTKKLKYYDILMKYGVTAITLDDEAIGLNEVIEIFERLNLGGKKLSLFSIIAARTYQPSEGENGGFDLSEKYKAFNKGLEDRNYGEIHESTYLQAIASCLIGSVKKADILRQLTPEIIVPNYSDVEKALTKAIDHLKGDAYGVKVANLLPYPRLLVAFTFFHYQLKTKIPTASQEKYLVDFFWRCVIGKRYNSAADTNLNTDLSKIQKIIDGDAPAQESITLSPSYIWENGRFSLSSAFVLGMLCLMAQKSPQSLVNGRIVDITNTAISTGSKRQHHHFFPTKSKVVKSSVDIQRRVNNVVNIVFMDSTTNDQISSKNPSEYIKEISATNPNIEEVLATHYIGMSGFGILEDDFDAFVNARTKAFYDKLRLFIINTPHDSFSEDDF